MTSGLSDPPPFGPLAGAALDGAIGSRLRAVSAASGERLAIGDGDTRLSYAALQERVDAAAAAASGLAASGPVAVLLPHSWRLPAALLGVMSSGRPAIPLDADHPMERNSLIARHAGAAAVVSSGEMAARARALFGGAFEVLDLEALPAAAPPAPPDPSEVACILYTSGSTGQPKGVFQDHAGILHDIAESASTARIGPDDRFALFYSAATIAGMRNLLTVVLTGASGEILSPTLLGARAIVEAALDKRLTVLRGSPTLLRHVVRALEPGERLDSVRSVVLGGERVEWDDVAAVRAACGPAVRIFVHLGATECWAPHTQWCVDDGVRPTAPRLPVGRPVQGLTVRLTGPDGGEVPDGEVGEIVASGRHISLGYWREPELTAKAFGRDPHDPLARTYRAGDLARRRPDGLLEFLGRQDQQIKLHGYRIEPGELEAALRACSGVQDAAVVVRSDAAGKARALAAYVELKAGVKGLRIRHLRTAAAWRVPAHMRPAEIVALKPLPWLPNFKIDRRRLAEIDAERCARAAAPAEPLEGALCALFARAAGASEAGLDDSLLSLGGDSLQAVGLALELQSGFGLALADGEFDPSRTIAEWVALVRAAAAPKRALPQIKDAPEALKRRAVAAADEARRTGSELDLRALSPLAWVGAAHQILTAGDLELGAWLLERMSRAYPGMPFASGLSALLEKTPAAEGLTPFQEDPAATVQVAARPGAPCSLIFFAGGGDVGTGLPLAVVHRWFGLLDANLIYVRPFNEDFYLGGVAAFGEGRAAMVEGLGRLLAELGAPRTVCLGHSMGTFPAVRFGPQLGAQAIMALSPVTALGAGAEPSRVRRRLERTFPGEPFDLRPVWQAARRRPKLTLVYGEHCWDDRLQAERFADLPAVELRPLAGYESHLITRELILNDALLPLLRELTSAEAAAQATVQA